MQESVSLADNSTKNKKLCEKQCSFYQAKFPDVHYISSSDLVELHRKGENLILVDVRTGPERRVSMIEGSITKEEFLEQQLQRNDDKDALVVTYCTVGYRSGLEARRLGLQLPERKDKIRSLDGYVAYTHALGQKLQNNSITMNEKALPPQLINPETGQPTNQVHTFGWMWGCVDERNFESTHFSFLELMFRMLQVVVAVITCFVLRIRSLYHSPPRRALLDEVTVGTGQQVSNLKEE